MNFRQREVWCAVWLSCSIAKFPRHAYSAGRLEPEYCRINIRGKGIVNNPLPGILLNLVHTSWEMKFSTYSTVLWLDTWNSNALFQVDWLAVMSKLVGWNFSRFKLSIRILTELEKADECRSWGGHTFVWCYGIHRIWLIRRRSTVVDFWFLCGFIQFVEKVIILGGYFLERFYSRMIDNSWMLFLWILIRIGKCSHWWSYIQGRV